MFRALLCSSLGGQIVLVQHLSLSLSFFSIIKVLLLGIFSVHTPGYKKDLNCSFNQFTWVVTHPVRGIKGSDLLGFDSTAVKNVSLSLGDYLVHRLNNDFPCLTCVLNSHLKRVTRPYVVIIQYDLLRMSTIVLETCRGI